MKYKGYEAHIEFDDNANVFRGEVIGLSDVITFQGTCVEELEEEFHISLDEYLKFCEEMGRKPEKPYSGKLPLRLPPELHAKIANRAKKENISINKWINEELERSVR